MVLVMKVLGKIRCNTHQIEIKSGTSTVIRIKPVQHLATESFKMETIEDRSCRFTHELGANTSMFKQYKQLGCMFECRLNYAITSSGCIPWNYPVPGGLEESNFDICVANSYGLNSSNLALFQQLMDSEESMANCECSPDCEQVTYEPQVNSFDLDVEALCDFNNEESKESIDLALREWQRTNSPITHWYNMVARYLNLGDTFYNPALFNVKPSDRWTFYYGLPKEDAKEMCKTVYKETIAKVTIEILDPMVLQIKKDVSSTFTSRLGVVGMNLFSSFMYAMIFSCALSFILRRDIGALHWGQHSQPG